MATKTMKIVRGLAGKDATIFNDKCANGDRSIKVWRWDVEDYLYAKTELVAAGLTAVLTTHVTQDARRVGGKYTQHRLRVTE
jgi:hypothetical protein